MIVTGMVQNAVTVMLICCPVIYLLMFVVCCELVKYCVDLWTNNTQRNNSASILCMLYTYSRVDVSYTVHT